MSETFDQQLPLDFSQPVANRSKFSRLTNTDIEISKMKSLKGWPNGHISFSERYRRHMGARKARREKENTEATTVQAHIGCCNSVLG